MTLNSKFFTLSLGFGAAVPLAMYYESWGAAAAFAALFSAFTIGFIFTSDTV